MQQVHYFSKVLEKNWTKAAAVASLQRRFLVQRHACHPCSLRGAAGCAYPGPPPFARGQQQPDDQTAALPERMQPQLTAIINAHRSHCGDPWPWPPPLRAPASASG
jgi:hypothetical protein